MKHNSNIIITTIWPSKSQPGSRGEGTHGESGHAVHGHGVVVLSVEEGGQRVVLRAYNAYTTSLTSYDLQQSTNWSLKDTSPSPPLPSLNHTTTTAATTTTLTLTTTTTTTKIASSWLSPQPTPCPQRASLFPELRGPWERVDMLYMGTGSLCCLWKMVLSGLFFVL